MSTLQECLLAAMESVSTAKIASQETTKTIKAQIIEVVDRSIGLYKVKYLENIFTVYSNNTSILYQYGDNVYVLVPNGNFSQEKFIIGKVGGGIGSIGGSGGGGSDEPGISVPVPITTEYIEVSQDIAKLGDSTVRLCSYKTEEKSLNLSPTFHREFGEYSKVYKTFSISCKIRTGAENSSMPFPQQQVNGDYGLELTLPVLVETIGGEKESREKKVIINKNNILGNPYNLLDWSNQKFYITFEANEEYDYSSDNMPTLTAFVKDFVQAENKPDDIFIKDIQIKSIDVVEAAKLEGYYSYITSDTGNYFLNTDSNNKKLTVHLKANGLDVDASDYECYWFEEDFNVKNGGSGYDKVGGPGWRLLNPDEFHTYSIEVSRDMYIAKRFKCVLLCNDELVISYITIYDITVDIDIALTTTSPNNVFSNKDYAYLYCHVDLSKVENVSPSDLDFEWTRYDKYGNLLDDGKIFYESSESVLGEKTNDTMIRFEASRIDAFNTIFCSVYKQIEETNINNIVVTDEDNNETIEQQEYKTYTRKLIGTKSIKVFTISNTKYFIAVQNADIIYKYDANGNSPLLADYDGPIGSRIRAITPIEFSIYNENGEEFREEQYTACKVTWKVPQKNTLLTFHSNEDDINDVLHERSLNYSIKNTYNPDYTNNTIMLVVKYGDDTIQAAIPITCIKEGQSGTNGTKYTAIIRYNYSDSEKYALGERDAQGRVRSARAIYIGEKLSDDIDTVDNNALQRWYSLKYNTEEDGGYLAPLSASEPISFSLDLYKDGEKVVDENLYNVKWSWYDQYSTNNCLTLNNNNIVSGKPWVSKDDIYCPILQAQVEITDNGTTQYIQSYYPIEITRINGIQELSFDNEEMSVLRYKGILPTMTGGFYSVLYSSDGKNPQYDSSVPFGYEDNLTAGQYENYEYVWSVDGKNLILKNNNKIIPNSSWTDASTKNYVKLEFTWSEAVENAYENELNQKQADVDLKKAWVNFYETQYPQDLNKLLDVINFEDIYSVLPYAITFVQQRAECLGLMKSLLEKLEEWRAEAANKSINYRETYNEVYKALIKNKDALASLCDSEKDCFGLKSLNTLQKSKIDTKSSDKKIKKLEEEFNALIVKFGIAEGKLEEYKYNEETDAPDNALVALHFVKNSIWAMADSALKLLKTQEDGFYEAEWIKNNQLLSSKALGLNTDYFYYEEIIGEVIEVFNEILSKYFTYPNDNQDSSEKNIKPIILNKIKNDLNAKKVVYREALRDLNNYKEERNISSSNITHIRPILFRTNVYEFSNINNWDGSKIYIDGDGTDEKGAYIFAPQVGAGSKDDQNRFTGLIMGVRNLNNEEDNEDRHGLYGYYQGQPTIVLDAKDGSATFGKSGAGQIHIDPNSDSAKIYGGNFNDDEREGELGGMEIDLSEPHIKFGTGNFSVDKDGILTATNAKISGAIEVGLGGKIGGWIIGETDLHNDVEIYDGRLTLNSATEEGYERDIDGDFVKIDDEYYEIENYYQPESIENYHGTPVETISYIEFTGGGYQGTLHSIFNGKYHYERGNWSDTEQHVWIPDKEGSYIKFTDFKYIDPDTGEIKDDLICPFYYKRIKDGYYYDSFKFYYGTQDNWKYNQTIKTNIPYENIILESFPSNDLSPSDYTAPLFSKEVWEELQQHYPKNGVASYIDNTVWCMFKEEVIKRDFDYNSTKQCYCKIEGQNQWVKIDKGTLIGEKTFILDNKNGDSFRLITENGEIYSKIYDKDLNMDSENYYIMIKVNEDDEGIYWHHDTLHLIDFIQLNPINKENKKIYEDLLITFVNNKKYPLVYKCNFIYLENTNKKDGINIELKETTIESFLYKIIGGSGFYSNNHINFRDTSDGFYLGSKGFSINKNIQFENSSFDPLIKISTGGLFKQTSLFIGNEGISLGYDNFVVLSDGKLVAKNAEIYSNKGNIGGFNIGYGELTGSGMKISAYGGIKMNGSIEMNTGNTITRGDEDFVLWYSEFEQYLHDVTKHEFVSEIPETYDADTIYFVAKEF